LANSEGLLKPGRKSDSAASRSTTDLEAAGLHGIEEEDKERHGDEFGGSKEHEPQPAARWDCLSSLLRVTTVELIFDYLPRVVHSRMSYKTSFPPFVTITCSIINYGQKLDTF
jgi:hypothetical protein